MNRFRALLAVLVIASFTACGDLPLEPQTSDADEITQRGLLGSSD